MNYTIHQLQIFLKVSQTGSITKAAEELHLTQPAVSIQLKKFQDQFAIPLTEVVGRKLYITAFGKEIAAAAIPILDQVHAINYKTQSFKGQLAGRLNLSSVSTGKYVMPYFLTGFIKQNPGVEFVMDVTNKSSVVEHLEKNQTDFALVSIVPDHIKVESIDLLQNELYLIGNTKELPVRGSSLQKILEQVPLIFREKGSGTRQAMELFLTKQHLIVPKKMELTSNEAIKQAVLAGLGYSIMPYIGLGHELKSDVLSIIPVKGLPIRTSWKLIWLKGKKHSPVAEAFLQYLRKEKSSIVGQWFT